MLYFRKENFWTEQAKKIPWFRFPSVILSQNEKGFYHWFQDGEMNTCYCCLDYQLEQGRGDQAGFIYDSPVTGTLKRITYLELKTQVEEFAVGLQKLGIKKGDTVVIYMPVIPEAAGHACCAGLGAIHWLFSGFPRELTMRIDDAEPKRLFLLQVMKSTE
jgi:acyl-coenzyme A synthetase/AMP-(fatty) acid ligase